ncbi:hypothetical protein L3D22_04945 [Lysobacter soli]|uniref:hypothetical protein n=1 Tax=Lysobacter soli TaxID=453783 RepID=UPI00209DD6EB|nr:hypothetical protein [Lysobacter soli]UTA55184.1 hypothetical protein L3D22_04945 [Lysobacter soli]
MLTSGQIEQLVGASVYPPDIAVAVTALSPLGIQIANRWMMGWPKRVKKLLADGTYFAALREQEKQERNVLADNQAGHLARHEVLEVYGLSLAPP